MATMIKSLGTIKSCCFLAVVLLCACAPFEEQPASVGMTSGTVGPTREVTEIGPSITEPPLATPSVPGKTPTLVLRPTLTKTPSPTATSLPTATPTIVPIALTAFSPLTATPAYHLDRALYLLETNGGCELPCWWGIKPGETRWRDARHFLVSIATEIVSLDAPLTYGADFYGPDASWQGRISDQTYQVRGGIVRQIDVRAPDSAAYNVPGLLARLGQPDDILLHVVPVLSDMSSAAQFVFYYAERGVLAHYSISPLQVGNESIIICVDSDHMQDFFSKTLTLRAGGEGLSVNEVMATSRWFKANEAIYRPLTEVTSLTVADFTERIVAGNERNCLETPREIWE